MLAGWPAAARADLLLRDQPAGRRAGGRLRRADAGRSRQADLGGPGRGVPRRRHAADRRPRRPAGCRRRPCSSTRSHPGVVPFGFTFPQPFGVVAAITPFNFPLNLVLHKVAPALAAGCAVVLKPSERTPLSAGLLAETLAEAGLPPGWLNIVTGRPEEIVPTWNDHPDVAVITFTGSAEVGWQLKSRLAAQAPRPRARLQHRDGRRGRRRPARAPSTPRSPAATPSAGRRASRCSGSTSRSRWPRSSPRCSPRRSRSSRSATPETRTPWSVR